MKTPEQRKYDISMRKILLNIQQKRKVDEEKKNKLKIEEHMVKMQPIIDELRRKHLSERPYMIIDWFVCKLDRKTGKYTPYNFMEGIDCKSIWRINRKL